MRLSRLLALLGVLPVTMTMDRTDTNSSRPEGATGTSSIVRQAADIVADAMGVERSSVRIIDPMWARLLKAGAKVDLHIGRWRAESALSLEDFGIQPSTPEEATAWRKVLRLGSGYLLPERERQQLASIEDKARNLLKDPGTSFRTHWGYFIPLGNADPERGREVGWKYQEWRTATEQLRNEYMALADEITAPERWSEIQAEVRQEYVIIGQQNYRRIEAAKGNAQPDPDAMRDFASAFADRRMAKVPGRETVRESFVFKWDVAYIPLQQQMAEDQAEASRILAENDTARAELFARAEVAMEMERDIQRTRKAQIEDGIKTFARDLQSQLSGLAYGVCCDVLEAIQTNGTVPGASVKQLRNLTDKIAAMNVWDDGELKRQMSEIRRLLNVANPSEYSVEIRNTMRKIGAEARLALMELDAVPQRSGRTVGIPDSLTGLRVVTGRGRTGDQRPLELASASELEQTGNGRSAAEERAL